MNELESRIQDVLNDPAQMAQIIQMANSLGLHAAEISQQKDPNTSELNESTKKSALLQALIPFLPPEKQRRLERAVKIGKISQLAGFALLQSRETE